MRDLHAVAPDHVAITGDLVNLALPAEFAEAGAWLRRLGPPEWISLVPGNHDALVKVPPRDGWNHWRAYATSYPRHSRRMTPVFPSCAAAGRLPSSVCRPRRHRCPASRLAASAPASSARVDGLLQRLREDRSCRVLLAHHCPIDGISRPRRRLIDAAELRGSIARHGADLILHGHEHMFSFGQIAGRDGPVPVFGTPSASRLSTREELTAQYYVYEIEARAGQWRTVAECRLFSMASGSFTRGLRRVVVEQDGALDPAPRGRPCDMPKIGLISNPLSQRNRRGLDEIGAAVRGMPDVVHITTGGREALDKPSSSSAVRRSACS